MLFSSLTFIFIFLPLVIILYYLIKEKYRNILLFIASLIFYSWGEPYCIFLLILILLINYLYALDIEKNNTNYSKRKLVLIIVFNILILGLFKYFTFLVNILNMIFKTHIKAFNLSMPIGISFYIFQMISYIIDVSQKRIKAQKNFILLGTYISFFPQLIAGPIVRYKDIEKQLTKRTHSLEKVCAGFRRFIIGLSKKVIIANNVAIISDTIFNNSHVTSYSFIIILFALLAFTLQIYYDFSGYSDMAIGLASIFGFNLKENFDYPYSALSISSFWKKWHISLTTWFKDYVYIPLGGNKCSKLKFIRNFLLVWLLTGLWHGANWNFIIWGLYYAIILLIEKFFLSKILYKIPKLISWIYQFLITNIGFLIFKTENLTIQRKLLVNLLTLKKSNLTTFFLENYTLLNYTLFIAIGLIFMFPIVKKLKKYENNHIYGYIRDIILIGLLIFSICSIINNSYNPFIYFRF